MSDPRNYYRTIWISDLHLATRGCKADFIIDFLRHHDADTFFLVGDIIDGWCLRSAPFWLPSHNVVIQKLLHKATHGTDIVYLPGNHDEAARNYLGVQFGTIRVADEAEHITADGRRLLVLHGDQFDGVVMNHKWLALMGAKAYNFALWMNTVLHFVRRRLGLPYWSLSNFLKQKVKNAVEFVTSFKTTLAEEARARGFDGVVCGHIHRAEIHGVDGIDYYNCGDWVESCTALVEHFDGRMEIVEWAFVMQPADRPAAAPSAAPEPTPRPLTPAAS